MRESAIQCGKMRNSLAEKIFREINSLVIYSVKMLLSQNFYQKIERDFP